MIQMLASVTNLQEAQLVLEADVDIIDLKNPMMGALGALPIAIVQEIVNFVAGRKMVSATIGDLPMQSDLIFEAVETMAATGVDIVKIGFFSPKQDESESINKCLNALKILTNKGVNLVAVMMADQNPSVQLLSQLKQTGFYGAMLDTASKTGKSLLECMVYNDLQRFVEQAHTMQLKFGLAGSLKLEDIPMLADSAPDYLGFRGAICKNFLRTNELSEDNLVCVKSLLQKSNKTMSSCYI